MNNKNEKNKLVYRIGIDARFFGLENKGLGRYTKELVEQLDKINHEANTSDKQNRSVEYYIFLKNSNFDDYKSQAKNIHKIKADYRWYSWGEQIFFPRLLNKYKLDLMHFTHFNAPIFYGGQFVVTIHDLILFHYPTIRNTTLNKITYLFKLSAYHFAIRMVARRARLIIAISKFTQKDIINSLGVKKKKIKVIYEGAEFGNLRKNFSQARLVENSTSLACGGFLERQMQSQIFQKYGILNKYVLYVGNAYPHKNLERLVLVFKELDVKNQDGLQLVLVGKKDYFYQRLEEFIRKNDVKNIIITDYVSDCELEELYKRARIFVFPSLYEGFGLPPLEALVKGLPVVSSSKSSLPEVLGDKVRYFDPEDINSIKGAMNDALLNGSTTLTSEEIRKIKNKFNWQKMTKNTEYIYKQIIFNARR